MAARPLDMKQIREILRLRFEIGVKSNRQIAKSLGIGKTSIAHYLRLAANLGISEFSQIAELSETELNELFFLSKDRVQKNSGGIAASNALLQTLPDFGTIHDELRGPGVTLTLLWCEYRTEHPKGYSYSQFREYYERWRKKLTLVMRQNHRPGEKAFSDFSGDGMYVTDRLTGEKNKVEIFVAALGASAYTFACAVKSQKLPDWIECHRKFFEWIQGVPAIMVPDNLKSGVKQADRYEPEINFTYQQMSEHYGTCIIPARVRKPKDKAKVENGVLQAQRWIIAVNRHRTFYSLAEINAKIRADLEVLNTKIMRGYGKSRRELYELIDRPALKPLPQSPYEFADWKKVKLGVDYHVRFDDHFYSAPYRYSQMDLWVRTTGEIVEIFCKGQRIASHGRSYIKWKNTTITDHMPSHHKAHAEWTPERIVSWASAIGAKTAQGIHAMLEAKNHPELAYQSALGIISLAKKYGNTRVEKASNKAINIGSFSYRTLKTMLKNRMEEVEFGVGKGGKQSPSGSTPIDHEEQLKQWTNENLRGSSYYN